MRSTDMDAAIENSLIDLCKKAAAQSNGRLMAKETYSCTMGCPDDWYNRAFDFRPPDADSRWLLDRLSEDIRAGDAPPTLLLSVQSMLPERLLSAYGFRRVYAQTGMAVDLTTWEAGTHGARGDCWPLAEERELLEWIAVTEEAFGKVEDPTLYRSLMQEPDTKLFACHAAGRVVSTALLFFANGAAGIHLVATSTDFRRRGYATAVTAAALRCAQAAGYGLAVLQASAAGKEVYARLGFSEFSQLGHWRLGESPK